MIDLIIFGAVVIVVAVYAIGAAKLTKHHRIEQLEEAIRKQAPELLQYSDKKVKKG